MGTLWNVDRRPKLIPGLDRPVTVREIENRSPQLRVVRAPDISLSGLAVSLVLIYAFLFDFDFQVLSGCRGAGDVRRGYRRDAPNQNGTLQHHQ